jgi:hypothetical protein
MHRCVCPAPHDLPATASARHRERCNTQHPTRNGRPKPGKHSAAGGGGGREECPWLAPATIFQGRDVPFNENPADANPCVRRCRRRHHLPLFARTAHAYRTTGRVWAPGRTQDRSRGPTRASRLTTHATAHMASYSVTRVKLVGSSCTFMQVQNSAYTIGGHPNKCMQPSSPTLSTIRRGAMYTATGQTPSGQLLRYGLCSEGGQRSSPKLEGRRSPLCVGPPGRIPLRRVLLCSTPHRLLGGTRSRPLSNGLQSPSTWDRQLELRTTVRRWHTLTTTTPFLTSWHKNQLRARQRSRLCLSVQCLVQEAWTPLLASLVTADTALRADTYAAVPS